MSVGLVSNDVGNWAVVYLKFDLIKNLTCRFSFGRTPFSRPSFLFAEFSATRFKKSSRQFECLMCSMRTLIRFAKILPLISNEKKRGIAKLGVIAKRRILNRRIPNSSSPFRRISYRRIVQFLPRSQLIRCHAVQGAV